MKRSPLIVQTVVAIPSAARREIDRRAFTLMEMMISIGLVTLLMAGLYSAMNLTFNLQMDSHDEIERLQIARTLLRQISRDVQSVVFEESLSTDEESSAGTSGTSSSGSSGTGSSGSGANAGGLSASGNTGSTTASGSGDSSDVVTEQPGHGILGTETELLLYVSRPDRGLSYVDSQELTSLSERSGDLMIVRYFMAQKGGGGLSSDIADRETQGSESGPVGLIRLTGDPDGISTAMQENEDEDQAVAAQLWSREVAQISFRYFDGSNWQTEWDSKELNALPQAVEIILTLRNTPSDSPEDKASDADDAYRLPETEHRMVVNLPIAKPWAAESEL